MRDLFYNNKLFNVTVILFKSIQKSFRNGAVIFHRSEEMRFPLSLRKLIIQHLRNLDSVFTFLEQLGQREGVFHRGIPDTAWSSLESRPRISDVVQILSPVLCP